MYGPATDLWNTYVKDAWPQIQDFLNLPFVMPTMAIVITATNLLLVSFQTTGFNQVAVFFTIAKATLRDQTLGDGITLYGFFDLMIDIFSTT